MPVFFFINKMDLEGADAVRAMEAVRSRLTEDAVLIGGPEELGMEGALAEFVAERDEEVLEAYLEGKLTGEMGLETLQNLIRQRRAFIGHGPVPR